MRYLFALCLLATLVLTCATSCPDECFLPPAPARLSQWALSPLSNTGIRPEAMPEGIPIPRDAFGIRIACPLDADLSVFSECGFEYYVDTPMISLRIISLYDLDAGHPAGSVVNDLFRCRLPHGLMSNISPVPTPASYPGVSSDLTQYDSAERALQVLNVVENNTQVITDLLLISPPDAPVEASFRIEMTRSDSSKVSLTLPKLLLQ